MRNLFDLPQRVPGVVFEPALGIDAGEARDLEALDRNGWHLIDPSLVTAGPDEYRGFVQQSLAEVGVAKSGYVSSQCGWFSDRSACYLASGRPVVAQDTGWRHYLPSGEGLLAFSDAAEAADGLAEILGNYRRHAKAARTIARELLDSRQVLSTLLERVEVST
jgi:glycosyltransferase involved in cell wall biosynthesis